MNPRQRHWAWKNQHSPSSLWRLEVASSPSHYTFRASTMGDHAWSLTVCELKNPHMEVLAKMYVYNKSQALNYPNTNYFYKATHCLDQSNYYDQSFVNHHEEYFFSYAFICLHLLICSFVRSMWGCLTRSSQILCICK